MATQAPPPRARSDRAIDRQAAENGGGKKLLKIGEVANLFALNYETIRFCELQNLIAKPERLADGYRGYCTDELARFIR